MQDKLNVKDTLLEALNLGIKNVVNLLLTALLYIVTIWIPYLNVGTTIGFYKIIVALSKGEEIVPTSIFSKENYKGLGDFFLLIGLQSAGLGAAAIFFLVPAMVLGLAWQYALYFFVDKKMSPLKSLSTSYDTTCGEKWRLFFVYFAFGFIVSLVAGVFGAIPKVGAFFAVIIAIVAIALAIALEAVLYKHFAAKFESAE